MAEEEWDPSRISLQCPSSWPDCALPRTGEWGASLFSSVSKSGEAANVPGWSSECVLWRRFDIPRNDVIRVSQSGPKLASSSSSLRSSSSPPTSLDNSANKREMILCNFPFLTPIRIRNRCIVARVTGTRVSFEGSFRRLCGGVLVRREPPPLSPISPSQESTKKSGMLV